MQAEYVVNIPARLPLPGYTQAELQNPCLGPLAQSIHPRFDSSPAQQTCIRTDLHLS
jgi:hypothetical protein